MSELSQPLSCGQTLGRIQERLSQGASAIVVIEEMMPRTRDEALSWGRRLAVWDEYAPQYPAQAVALARIVSRRTMREFSLTLRDDGRVVEKSREPIPWQTPMPTLTFPLELAGEPVQVEYTPEYFPCGYIDMLSFVTRCRTHLVPSDVVEACGGPQAYAVLLADAILRGEEKQFKETFEGAFPKEGQHQRRQAKKPRPAPGGHAARVIAEEEKPPGLPPPGMLF
jgi:hypothetical protein